jgi:putative membrane protein
VNGFVVHPRAVAGGAALRSGLMFASSTAALLALPDVAAAHGEFIAPDELWRAWTLDWWVLAGVFVPAWLYARGLRRLWGRAGVGRGVRRWQAWCYAAGIFFLFVSLVSPLDSLGGALFSAHMLQHVVLMLVAAPLLVLGNPLVPWFWALPMGWRRRLGGWGRNPDVRGVWHVFSNPVSAWLLHAAAVWVWHVPVLYEATLDSELVHLAQHAAFFGTALLFWWAAFEFGRRRRLRYGFGSIYVFTTALHSSILGALLTFSLVIWYPIYSDRTAAWGLTALEDQQLGGLVMWIPAGIIYLVVSLGLLALGLGVGGSESGRRDPGWIEPEVLPVPLPLGLVAGEHRQRPRTGASDVAPGSRGAHR